MAYKMRLTWTATLAIAYGNRPTQAALNKQKARVPLETPQLEPHPTRLDAVSEIEKKPRDHATASTSKHETTEDGDVRMSRKDHGEKLKPEGTSVNYTEQERKMLTALLEKKVSNWMETLK